MENQINKLKLLLNAIEAASDDFYKNDDKECISRIIAAIGALDLQSAILSWQTVMQKLENNARGRGFPFKREGEIWKGSSAAYDNLPHQYPGDDFCRYICSLPFDKLLKFHSSDHNFEVLIQYPDVINKLFHPDNIIEYYHIEFILWLLNARHNDHALDLLARFRNMLNIPGYKPSHGYAIYYILIHISLESWEQERTRIHNTITSLGFKFDPYEAIQNGYRQLMERRLDSMELTKNFIQSISSGDFEKADKCFHEAKEIVGFDFSLEYFMYRTIQKIKIDDWMNCDDYVYKLLAENNIVLQTTRIDNAIKKKQILKHRRLLKI